MFIEILFQILLFKGGVLIYAEHCMYISVMLYIFCIRFLHFFYNLEKNNVHYYITVLRCYIDFM